MKDLEWEDYGIPVDGKNINNLRFADDIVLCAKTPEEAQRMLDDLDRASKKIGLEMNKKKSQSMRNPWCSSGEVKLEGQPLEEVTSYIYLGRSINMEGDLRAEVGRRRRAAWTALGSIKEVTKMLKNDKRNWAHLFDSTVLPALCYGTETWATTQTTEQALRTTHRALERNLLGYNRKTQHDQGLRSTDLRQLSGLRDPMEVIERRRLRWAGHVARRTDDRWTIRITEWIPRGQKRPVGRPATRWSTRVAETVRERMARVQLPPVQTSRRLRTRNNAAKHWATIARDREMWKQVVICAK